uniref:Uncharacterized protein n=1 Tax=Lactuca sativa TaxID=4236 RepID=A0A9R1XVZ3_LACSA|nr:hypothetical protein LSAT_V11C200058200 [Lactuca sativa]
MRNQQSIMTNISELKRDGIGSPIQLRIIRNGNMTCIGTKPGFSGDAIQILGQHTSKAYIESVFNVSDCYTVSEYNCPELDKHQKVLESDLYIDVRLSSVIKPLSDTMTIPTTWFCFASKSQLAELGEHPPYFLDLIEMLSKIRDCTKHDGQPYVLLIPTDSIGNEIPINIWKECITNPAKFNCSLLAPSPAITIVAVTN